MFLEIDLPAKLFNSLFLIKINSFKKTWRLFSTPFFSLYLSKLFNSDSETHKHSKNFISIVLSGEYFEYSSEGDFKVFRIGSINKKSCHQYHKVCLANSYNPTWILTFTY